MIQIAISSMAKSWSGKQETEGTAMRRRGSRRGLFNASRRLALTELRMRVGPGRIPDVVASEMPLPEEEFFNSPPYLFVEVMSPDDPISAMHERFDDYLRFGVPHIWVVDPWKHRGWNITDRGWMVADGGVMRTADGRIAVPLGDVLLP